MLLRLPGDSVERVGDLPWGHTCHSAPVLPRGRKFALGDFTRGLYKALTAGN